MPWLLSVFPAAMLLVGCSGGKPLGKCDCTEYPFPQGCDAACGITAAVVESVHADSVTVRVQPNNNVPAEIKTIPLARLRMQGTLRPGMQVQLTYEKTPNAPRSFHPSAVKSVVPLKK
jgi:hypothetical protein